MLDAMSDSTLVALIGLFGGILLGLAARFGRFCTLGAIEDLYYGEDTLRALMWGVALGVAIIGTYGLSMAGLLNLNETLYVARAWNPWESIVGGLMFGYGMALAGNCGYGALARAGGGDFRSLLLVVVIGIAAYMMLGGPLSGLRIWLFGAAEPASAPSTITTAVADGLNLSADMVGVLIGATFLFVTLLNKKLRRSAGSIVWGAVAGLAIVSGWAGTQWVASNGYDATPVISHTFSAPAGETLLYMMTSSGNSISFGTGSVLGVLLGALAGSLLKGQFRWEACEDPRELRRQLLGATLMGFGAVLSVGCSVGQGLSAFSVLAYSAPLTLVCIMAGAALGLRQLIVGFSPTASFS